MQHRHHEEARRYKFQVFFILLLLYDPSSSSDPELQIRFPGDGGVREKRQIQTGFKRTTPDLDVQQGCKIEGYEKREREICEEIVERICLVRDTEIPCYCIPVQAAA